MRFLPVLVITLFAALPSFAAPLGPKNVFVISNKAMPESKEVADHYLAKRGVPKENHIELDLPKGENISRADYDAKIVTPLKTALKDRREDIKVLLTVYGVPLRVGPKYMTATEQKELAVVKKQLLAEQLKLKDETDASQLAKLQKSIAELTQKQAVLSGDQSGAAVDSELMLMWWPEYTAARWIANPLNWQVSESVRLGAPQTLMTARLDGPSPAIAKRLVDDAMKAEATGLKGIAYIDARGVKFDAKKANDSGTGYGGYDESYREAAALLKSSGMEVVLDDKEPVFEAGSCKNCALYSGWYSLAKFVDSCEFVTGAVAWHLASAEATTLRDDKSTVWCPNLLKKGAAVTIGPVAEPYTIGFPKPAEFFGFLATGKFTVVECYARTLYFASWQSVLVGDPLYNPFAKNPIASIDNVKISPIGTRVFR